MINTPPDSLFADATADITDPRNLELAQATFNEQLLYKAIASFARDWSERTRKPARVLDLCAAPLLISFNARPAICAPHPLREMQQPTCFMLSLQLPSTHA